MFYSVLIYSKHGIANKFKKTVIIYALDGPRYEYFNQELVRWNMKHQTNPGPMELFTIWELIFADSHDFMIS
jgi:hypothetical protein